MRKLITLLFTAGALVAGEEKFEVEKLTECEVKELADARVELEEAKAKLARAENRVKVAHGGSDAQGGGIFSGSTSCLYTTVEVEIRGGYALITTNKMNLCIGSGSTTGHVEVHDGTSVVFNGSGTSSIATPAAKKKK